MLRVAVDKRISMRRWLTSDESSSSSWGRALIHLTNTLFVTPGKNAERVRELNPRHGTRRSILYVSRKRFIRELLQSSGIVTRSLTQGVALGWNLLTPSAFLLVRQTS